MGGGGGGEGGGGAGGVGGGGRVITVLAVLGTGLDIGYIWHPQEEDPLRDGFACGK